MQGRQGKRQVGSCGLYQQGNPLSLKETHVQKCGLAPNMSGSHDTQTLRDSISSTATWSLTSVKHPTNLIYF